MSVEKATGKWQSFSAGLGGNVYTFLTLFYGFCKDHTTLQNLSLLATNRKLPVVAFEGEVAFNDINGTYLIPMRNSEGKIVNLSHCYPGKGIIRTAGCKTSLTGLELLIGNERPIYICEGEWDMLALRWFFTCMKIPAIVVCVPGASIFKDEWVPFLANREIYCCYDNDMPGSAGEHKAATFLRPVVKEISFLEWPESFPEKYDVRDFILAHNQQPFSKKRGDKCWEVFKNLFTATTKKERENPQAAQVEQGQPVIIPQREELEGVYYKWLKLKDEKPIALMYGTIFANRLQGESIWMFLVAPPGGTKTSLLSTLSKSPEIETTTSLTPAALISGIRFQQGQDPSILLKVDGKVLVIKDFTTILEGNPMARDEIFGILRDVYDGYVEKYFGHIGKKSYTSKFGVLSGVTSVIDSYTYKSTSLGERFLKYRLDKEWTEDFQKDLMERALGQLEREGQMREELQNVAYRYLTKKMPETLPTFTKEQSSQIIQLAKFTAWCRGSVSRDKFTGEMTAPPSRELGTRLTKQFMKLAVGICVYYEDEELSHRVMNIIKEVAFDTAPAITVGLVKKLYMQTKHSAKATVPQRWVNEVTNMPPASCGILLNNLMMLDIIIRVTGMERVRCEYRLNKNLYDIINASGIFAMHTPGVLHKKTPIIKIKAPVSKIIPEKKHIFLKKSKKFTIKKRPN